MTKCVAFALLLASLACAAEYVITPDDASSLRLEVDKTGLLRGKTHVFTFTRYRGEVSYSEAAPAQSKVSFTIDAPSISCNDAWVSAKDLVKVQQYARRDMLAVDQYKNLSFRSTAVTAQQQNVVRVLGLLTIRDVTKPVEVSVKLSPSSGNILAAEGKAAIKLSDFNLKPQSAALGTIGTSNDMRLIVRLKLVRSNL